MNRPRAVHFDTLPASSSELEPGAEVQPAKRACGAKTGDATTVQANVTCGNCKRRMPQPIELVEFVATFHENPNIDACPECLPAVAEILEANPDAEPAELELPHCDFCDDLRLVYVKRAPETEPPTPSP